MGLFSVYDLKMFTAFESSLESDSRIFALLIYIVIYPLYTQHEAQ